MVIKEPSVVGKITSGISILATLPVVHAAFTVASLWHTASKDVTEVSNGNTPILLIHGSDSNQHQWWYFRRWLVGPHVGHVFTVNLNEQARRNNPDCDIMDYVNPVQSRLLTMKQLYATNRITMDHVILVGFSMGGLVAAAYCLAEFEENVEVSALISLCTPWKGSYLADLFCNTKKSPEKYFCRTSKDREALAQRFELLSKMNY